MISRHLAGLEPRTAGCRCRVRWPLNAKQWDICHALNHYALHMTLTTCKFALRVIYLWAYMTFYCNDLRVFSLSCIASHLIGAFIRRTSNKPESPVWSIDKELRDKETICKHVNGKICFCLLHPFVQIDLPSGHGSVKLAINCLLPLMQCLCETYGYKIANLVCSSFVCGRKIVYCGRSSRRHSAAIEQVMTNFPHGTNPEIHIGSPSLYGYTSIFCMQVDNKVHCRCSLPTHRLPLTYLSILFFMFNTFHWIHLWWLTWLSNFLLFLYPRLQISHNPNYIPGCRYLWISIYKLPV